jgi:adenylylsulfate kinase
MQAAQGWAVWFVGLPGSGKSSLARDVAARLEHMGRNIFYLQMDARRKAYFPNPRYTARERALAYELFAQEGAALAASGKCVVMDGTAPKSAMREYCRLLMPRFAEVFVRCSLQTAMAREEARPEGLVMAGLYAKALERKKTGREFEGLGQVIGVDVPFEENPAAECVVDNEHQGQEAAANQALECILAWEKKDRA